MTETDESNRRNCRATLEATEEEDAPVMTATASPPLADAPLRAPARPGSRVRIGANVALGGIAVGAVAVAGLWWQDTDFVYGLGSWLTNAGRITGLAAGYAILVVLVLMARVPALDRGVGSDRLARWHAAGGRYTVGLAVAHTLLIIWGYAVTAHTGVVPESATLVLDYPDVLMATAGLGLFLLVGVTSARAARKRLRYETWHLLHLYTYLAIALVFSHQFATGADFTDARVRVLWAGMYIVVGAVLAWYRLITPLANLSRHSLRVEAVCRTASDIVSVVFAGRNIARLDPRPGQFFRWRFLTRDLWTAANPYSLSAAPSGDRLRITVKTAGAHSAALAGVHPGTRVLAEGPYGAFTGEDRRPARRGTAAAARCCWSGSASASRRSAPCSRRSPQRPVTSPSSTGPARPATWSCATSSNTSPRAAARGSTTCSARASRAAPRRRPRSG